MRPADWTTALEHEDLARRMARSFAIRFGSLGLEAEDLAQAALISLARASKDYRDDKGATFRTFATRRVWGGLILEGKKQAPHYKWDRKRHSVQVVSLEKWKEAMG